MLKLAILSTLFSLYASFRSTQLAYRKISFRNIIRHHLYKLNLEEIGFTLPSTPENNDILQNFRFHLLEVKDLPKAADLSMKAFYKPRLVLNTARMSPIEAMLLSGIASFFSKFDRIDSYLSNYIGFSNRGGRRLMNPSFTTDTSDSFIIAASYHAPHSSHSNSNKCLVSHEELVGIVEINLEEPTGLLSQPLKNPFAPVPLNRQRQQQQPYLCNLCVATDHRRVGLGKVLCQLCEYIAVNVWRKTYMYLHVEKDNIAAQRLYTGMGYEKISVLSPGQIITNNMEKIDYYRKHLL